MTSALAANDPVFSKYTEGVAPRGTITTNATSASAQRNREFIGGILEHYLSAGMHVFEVGSGTADQSIYFGKRFPHISWQTSDVETYHSVIKTTLHADKVFNVLDPVTFDIDAEEIEGSYEAVYASNVVHCIPWETTEKLFKKAATALKAGGVFILYGPYNIDGKFTSEGNMNFNAKLQAQDSRLALRDIKDVTALAKKVGLAFEAKHDHVGVNNYVLIFKKIL